MSKTLKIISVILSVLTIIGVFSVANPVLAAEVNEEYAITQTIENIKTEKEEAVIIGEIESKRDKYTKVFQKSDGASVAVITSTPVHYEKDGVWVDIDNTLIETEENNEMFFENKSNDFTVTLPQEMDENDAVSIEKDGYTISFTLDGYDVFEKNEKSKSKKKEKVKKAKSKTKIDDSFIDKNETLVYESVGENTDIEYSVTATGLKEDIILTKKPKSGVSYTYTIIAENLYGNPHEDGSVSFTDSKGNVIFNIPAPIMFDAKNKSSTDITVKFSGEKGNYKLTYTPSYNWLKKEAKYPVTIDPVITLSGSDVIADTYVNTAYAVNTGTLSILGVNKTSSSEMVTLIGLEDRYISPEIVVKNAILNIRCNGSSTLNNGNIEIGAYPIKTSWEEDTITTISSNMFGEMIDKAYYNNNSEGTVFEFDITKCFLSNVNSYGVALRQTTTKTDSEGVMFDSSETTNGPYFTIEYYETNGVKNQFDYHMQDVGRAGTVYYNDFTGQVHIEREDIGLYCLYEPVNIKSYYNSGLGSNITTEGLMRNSISPFSLGWSTNYNQTIEYVGEIGNGRYLYRDEDGDVIYLKKDTDTTYIEDTDMFSDSKGYKLYGEKNANSAQLKNIRIVDSNNRTMYFDNYGNLTRITTSIEDSENSSNKVNYSTTIVYRTDVIPFYQKPYLIDKIIDNLGREYRFSYIDNETLGFPMVSSISVFNNEGTQITVGGKDYKINYTYTNQNFNGTYLPTLSAVTYPDGGVVNYTLSGTRQLLKNIDGYTIDINKPNSNSHTITEKVVRNTTTTGNILTINRSNSFERIFTDVNNIQQTKQFDAYGRVTCEIEGTKVVPRVFRENNVSLGEVNSRLYNTPLTPVSYENDNLIKNSSFESALDESNWSEINGATKVSDMDASANTTNKNSIKIIGETGKMYSASQVIDISNPISGDEYYLQFSTNQINSVYVENNLRQSFVLVAARKKITGNEQWQALCYVFVNPMNESWQTYGYSLTSNIDYNQIKVSLCNYNQHGTAYFDDIKLINTYKATATSGSSGSSGTTGGANSSTQCTCDGCTDFNCPCTNCRSNCTQTSCKRGFDFANSASGSNVSITDGEKSISFSSDNDNNCNYPESQTDINGITTDYIYDPDTGLLTKSTKGNNGTIEYSYNALGELASVSQTVSGLGTMQTNYSYENDRVKSITHNGFSYNYEYDVWGNVSSVKVGNQPLVSYNYDSGKNRNRINKITYGNGDYTVYTFNSNGNISMIKSCKSNGSVKSIYQYTYSAEGSLTAILDVVNKIQTLYNGQNVTIKHLNDPGTSDDVVYNTYTITDDGDIVENYGGMSYTTTDVSSTYKSSTGGSVDKSKLVLNPVNSTSTDPFKEYSFTSETDYFGRTLNKNTQTFYAEEDGINIDMFFKSQYKYKDLSTTQTTTLIESYKSTVGLCAEIDGELQTEVYEEIEYFYEYDNVGNITRIYFKEYDDDGSWLRNVTVCSYVYDKANQLVRENNAILEKTYVFVYNVGGNIVSKSEYEFTEISDLSTLTATDTITYSYNSVWKDKLEYFNDVKIEYDEIGNPRNYVSKLVGGDEVSGSLTWNGRQLASVQLEDYRYEYFYDQNGLRIKSLTYDSDNVIESITNYMWNNGVLSGYSIEKLDSDEVQTIKILFDNTGDSIGYTFYDTSNNNFQMFYFQKNLQGDVISVCDSDGSALVTYNYDAWGNITPTAHGGSLEAALEALIALMYTPITYRGYNYDINTGLYYLQSRYYNPAYGRFLNADDTDILELTKGTVHGANLFAYCNNNPVMNVDYNGLFGVVKTVLIILVLLIALLGWLFDWEINFAFTELILNYKINEMLERYSELEDLLEINNNLAEILDMYNESVYIYKLFEVHAKNIIDYGTGKNTNPTYPNFELINGTGLTYEECCSQAYKNILEAEWSVVDRGTTWELLTVNEQYIHVKQMVFYDEAMYKALIYFSTKELLFWGIDKMANFYFELL